MSSIIRKISIGSDYKTDAMHYSVGQSVYGGHTISHVIFDQNQIILIIFLSKKMMRYCRGRSLILTWQYPLNTI